MERFDEVVDGLLALNQLALRLGSQCFKRRFGQAQKRFVVGFERLARKSFKRLRQLMASLGEQCFLLFQMLRSLFDSRFRDGLGVGCGRERLSDMAEFHSFHFALLA